MKIAKVPPASKKSAVFVTKDCYELFYLKPIKLGYINRKGDYWYTADGMRFISNRDALEYLSKLWENENSRNLPPAQAQIVSSLPDLEKEKEQLEARMRQAEAQKRKDEEKKKKAVVIPPLKPSAPTEAEIAAVLQHLQTKARVAAVEKKGAGGSRKK